MHFYVSREVEPMRLWHRAKTSLTNKNMPGIIGKKLGMSQIIQDDGRVIPATFVKCDPNEVIQVKTKDKDGYPAIVLGFDAYKNPSRNKKFKTVKEFRVANPDDYKKGQSVTLESLKEIKSVTVTSVSKGKGFQGVVKRHHFAGGPESHGSHFHREPGSIGMRAKPGRVNKGKRMAGHMGVQTVTLKDRPVMMVVAEENVIAVKGPVPGSVNSYIYIKY
jgi:large subunit ribosomal protein L3